MSWEFLRHRKFWLRAALAALAIFVILPIVGASILPGNPLYPVKRVGEKVLTALTPGVNYQRINFKQAVGAVFAARRVNEAASMVELLEKRSVKKQLSDADTIEALLQQFGHVFNDLTLDLSQQIDRGEKPSQKFFANIQKRSAELYVKLVHMRLEAPPSDQATVLRSIVIMNNNLATIADTLGQAPVSQDDTSELTKLVSAGLISKTDLADLLDQAYSNRRLLDLLRERVKTGQLPSGILYAVNFDVVAKLVPDETQSFIHGVRFDELRKVALLMKTIEPTPAQKQAIEQYLKSYKAGDLVPTNALTRYTAPLVYGLHLVEGIGVDTSAIDAEHLSPERRIFYELWAPTLGRAKTKSQSLIPAALAQTQTPQTARPTYDQILQQASVGVIKSSALLDRVQLELLKALRSEVAYMALPPGWTATDISAMSDSFAQSVNALRQAEQVQAKTEQAVASLATVTAPLQETLSTQEADALRVEMKTAIETLRNQLVQNVFNSTFTTTNNTTVINQTVTTIDDDLAALRKRFETVLADSDTLAKAFDASLQALREAMTAVQDQLNAQAELVREIQTTIAQLKTNQNSIAEDITTAAEGTARLDATIADIKQTQTENLASLQTQLNNQVARAGELELSLVAVTQTQLEQQAALEAQVELNANQRQQIEQAVADLNAAQITSAQDVNQAVLAVQNQLSQSIAEVATAQTQTKTQLELIDAKTISLDTAIADIARINLEAQANLEAELAETKAIQDALAQSLTTLAQAQAQTAAEVATLRSDVSQISQSVSDIRAAQLGAQAQVDDLITASVDWANTAAAVELDLAALQQLQVDLNADFAAKSVQLQAQFESYQQQLDDGIDRLNLTADEQILRLQEEAARLQQLLQQTQTQLQSTTTPSL